MPIKLSSMALIELSGPDAVAFAQAQFCNDVTSLADAHWQWNAWLSPQGRVRFFFHLLRDNSHHLRLLMRGGDPMELREALKRFVLRSKVDVRVADTAQLYGLDKAADLIGDSPVGNSITSSDDASMIALSPNRFISIEPRARPAISGDLKPWTLADIHDGFPTIARALEDAALPQWLGLDRLGAVSVKKGCYPGQEIMSRLHFKGGNKRGLVRLTMGTAHVPATASPIAVRGESGHVGQIVMAAAVNNATCDALAILSHAVGDQPLALDDEPHAKVDIVHRFA